MSCPVCKFAKCRWIDRDPKKISTKRLKDIIEHNTSLIDQWGREGMCAYAEERCYLSLVPYQEELNKRNSPNS